MGNTKRLKQPRDFSFGPRSCKVINGSRRKPKKPIRFVSKPMKKIEEEVKRAQANIQSAILGNRRNRKDVCDNKDYGINSKICPPTVVINEQHMRSYSEKDQHGNYVLPQSKQHRLGGGKVRPHNRDAMKDGKVRPHNRDAMKEDFAPVVMSSKSGHAFSSDRLVEPTLTSSTTSNMKQGFIHHPNAAEMPSSRPKNLKAMPGLVLNRRGQLNIDQGRATGMHKRVRMDGCDDITNNDNLGSRKELLLEEKPNMHDDSDSEDENPIQRTIKRRRKYIDSNEDEDNNGVQSPEGVAYDSKRLTSQDDTLKDCHDSVSMPFVVDCLKKQCYCCSKPIDEPTWRGILNIGNKEYIPLSGHLSTKSCEKVRDLSKSLARVVEVTKVPRSKVWPKRWDGSRPMDDNIALYFFPHKMRPDNSHDHLLKEVMENDLALRASVGDTEMLMFPSILLPKRYQTFQMKHYLWGIFKPKEVEGKQGVAQHQPDHTTGASAFVANATATGFATDDAPITPGPTGAATNAASILSADATNIPIVPANHGRTDSSMGAPPSRMLAFVVKQTPRLEQLIREMQREGTLVMQGEMTSTGSWQDNIASVMQSGQIHGRRN
ncbi:unnamed protein product [Urochloa humidicola]